MSLEGRGVVVTGGGRGIGRAVARRLAENGAAVVVSARTTDEIESVAEELRADGLTAHAVRCDVADEASVAAMAEEAIELLGTVDILVNNAGIARSDPVKRLQLEDWNQIMAVNATGTFLCTRAFLPGMLERGWGRVINVASVAGLRGGRYIAAYVASKHAQIGFTKALAAEVASAGITANAICPGLLWTPMWRQVGDRYARDNPAYKGMSAREVFDTMIEERIPMKKEQTPEDIAETVAFFVSEDAKNITGQALNVDGGFFMR